MVDQGLIDTAENLARQALSSASRLNIQAASSLGPATPITRGPKNGFEGPVGAVIRLRLNRLRALLAKHSPVGKQRPAGFQVGKKFYRYRKTPPAPGSLKRSWKDKNTVRLSRTGKSIIIRNDLPYARAQDKGANIPERRPKRKGGFLMFPAGGKFFHRKAKAFRLKGQGYVRAAVDEWKRQFADAQNVRWAPHRGVKVEP